MKNAQKEAARAQLQRLLDADATAQMSGGTGYTWIDGAGIRALQAAIDAMPDEVPEPEARQITVFKDELFRVGNGEVVIATIFDDPPQWVHELMTNALLGDDDGSSYPKLIRLANGDLIYGRFPCGGTYEQISQGMKGAI